jgi:hypothetical protein
MGNAIWERARERKVVHFGFLANLLDLLKFLLGKFGKKS